jgi:hypothetical protein
MGLNILVEFVNLFLERVIAGGKLHEFNELVILRVEVFVQAGPRLKKPLRLVLLDLIPRVGVYLLMGSQVYLRIGSTDFIVSLSQQVLKELPI